MVSRYGYFILFKPPFVLKTAWLWLTPGVILLVGVIAAVRIIRKRATLAATDVEDNDLMDA
jgi:cytochrome c-type biogenesis protein CcmH